MFRPPAFRSSRHDADKIRYSRSQLVEPPSNLGEHSARNADVRRARSVQGLRHGLFYRPWRCLGVRVRARLKPQPRSPAVTGIAFTLEESSRNQPLQDSGDSTRVEPDNVREFSRRQSGKLAHDAQHEPLGSRDSQLALHAFGHPLESMLNGPQESHEIQDWVERVRRIERGIR